MMHVIMLMQIMMQAMMHVMCDDDVHDMKLHWTFNYKWWFTMINPKYKVNV
jgi:hypothetical protein